MNRFRVWLVPGLVLACATAACGSGVVQVDSTQDPTAGVRTPLAAPSGTDFALLPTTGVDGFSGEPTRWTARSIDDTITVSMNELPDAPVSQDEARGFLEVELSSGRTADQEQVSVEYVGDGLLALPVASWEKAVANPDERLDLEEATFTLGPLGEVTRRIGGSLSEGIRYAIESEHLKYASDVCSTCDQGFADPGVSVSVGDRYLSLYKVPSNVTGLEVDLPFWAVDDALVSETLVLVEFEAEDQEGSISWVDADGESQRHDVGVYRD